MNRLSAGVQVTTLANGLRVATDPMPTVDTASLGLWIEAGTRDETPAENGVSHFLEHMAFKGTARRGARAIAEEIEAVGGHLNAHTSHEYTAFYAKVLKEDVGLAADIVTDIVLNMTNDPEELERERTVVVQEILEADDAPDDVIFDRFQQTVYPDQSLGRSVLGTAELIRGMPRDVLLDYRRRHYGASRMVFAAAGRVDHETMVGLAERYLGELSPGTPPTREVARYVGGDWRQRRDLEQVHVILGFESVPFHHKDFYTASVLSTVLGGGMSSRLFQEVRERRGLVYSIYTFPATFADSGVIGIYAGAGQSEIGEVIPVICDVVAGLPEDLGEAEVARARTQLKANILMSRERSSSRCQQLARQLIVFDRPLTVDEIVAKVDAVTTDAVADAARRLAEGTPTLAAIGPVDAVEAYATVAERFAA